jgi:DNA-binding NtrC family response regulator
MPSIPAPRAHTLLFTEGDRHTLRFLVALALSNPCSRERVACERALLGDACVDTGPAWCLTDRFGPPRENLVAIHRRVRVILDAAREALARQAAATEEDLLLYQDACTWLLYDMYDLRLQLVIDEKLSTKEQKALFVAFKADHGRYFHAAGERLRPFTARYLFERFYVLRRAWYLIHAFLLGTSDAAVQLRCDVWESIIGDDLRLYLSGGPARLRDVHTLVLGPTGSGKDLVARAMGLSCHVAVNETTGCFVGSYKDRYRALNLAAKTESLIEAELLGYKRGAFTGATEDRIGDLDLGPDGGVIFLDEVAEIPLHTQVLLLRVLEAHEIQPVGSRETLVFNARVVAATHEDIDRLVLEKRMRSDLLYRMKANVVRTPSLRLMLDQAPGDLALYVRFFADQVCAPDSGEALAAKTMRYLERKKLLDYAWGGNLRELQKCVLGVLTRGKGPIDTDGPRAAASGAAPASARGGAGGGNGDAPASSRSGGVDAAVLRALVAGSGTLDEVTQRLVAWRYAESHNIREVGRVLGISRNTVRAKLDHALVKEFEALLRKRGR